MRHRYHRLTVTVLVALAMALHGVLSTAQAASPPAPGSLEAALQVICTGHGAQKLPDEGATGHDCQACSAPCHAPGVAPNDAWITQPLTGASLRAVTAVPILFSQAAYLVSPPRAPPSLL